MKSLKSLFTKTVCMLVLVSVSNSFSFASAQEAKPTYATAKEPVNNIRFVRLDGDMLVFELSLYNLPAKGSSIRIMDGENNLLFEEKISAQTYNVRYKIARENISKVNFEIFSKKVLLYQAFNVDFKTEEKLEVTKA
jgi:hypothetical protein